MKIPDFSADASLKEMGGDYRASYVRAGWEKYITPQVTIPNLPPVFTGCVQGLCVPIVDIKQNQSGVICYIVTLLSSSLDSGQSYIEAACLPIVWELEVAS